MQLYLHELKSYRKTTIVWSLVLALMTVFFLLMFPAFTKDIEASQKILSNLPAAVRDALGLSLQYFFTIYGFYSYMLTFILLGAAVQAMNLGVGIVSKEISGKTADFLLTKPLSRASVITSKLTASISLIILTNIFLLTVSLFAANKIAPTDFSFKVFGLLVSTIFFVQIAFLVLGFMLAVIIPKTKSVIAVSLPVVFSLFIIGTLGAIIGNDTVRYITIFKFFDTTYIIKNATYEPKFIVVETMALLIAVITSYIVFIRKDIQVTQ